MEIDLIGCGTAEAVVAKPAEYYYIDTLFGDYNEPLGLFI
jgi:hypothetical protein